VQAGVLVRNPDEPGLATNSRRTHYALTEEVIRVIHAFGARGFDAAQRSRSRRVRAQPVAGPLKASEVGRVYVSAFPSFREFKKYAAEIAWETEVWVAEAPDHMLHFNGDRFLGPRHPARG
jgi:hypothetical protein